MSHDDDLDRRLDEQLRAAFTPLPPERLREFAANAVSPSPTRPLWPIWLLATAALCMLTFVLAQAGDSAPRSESVSLGSMWVAAYEDAMDRGFSNCCDGSCGMRELGLAQTCEQRLDVRLEVAAGAEVELVGAYHGLPTGGCMTLLAETGTTPVCVFVIPRAEDRGIELPVGKSLHLARREVGKLVLYALSESPASAALGDFVAP